MSLISGGVTQGRSSFLDLVIEGREMDADIRKAIRELAREYEGQVKAELRRPKTGKLYGGGARRVYSRQRVKTTVFGKAVSYRGLVASAVAAPQYRASRPGEAPASRTGAEVGAVRLRFPSKGRGYSARVFADRGVAFYRHFLEFGTAPRVQRTQSGKAVNRVVGRVAPRPLFTPLQKRLSEDLFRRVERAVDVFVAFRR